MAFHERPRFGPTKETEAPRLKPLSSKAVMNAPGETLMLSAHQSRVPARAIHSDCWLVTRRS